MSFCPHAPKGIGANRIPPFHVSIWECDVDPQFCDLMTSEKVKLEAVETKGFYDKDAIVEEVAAKSRDKTFQRTKERTG